ncbi:hypothetical protein XI03_04960 [Bradyrhizobium sp. CCBAU 65884]|nr:hypothetical protein [Bradyrhizobium sp. CCBAU 65884]
MRRLSISFVDNCALYRPTFIPNAEIRVQRQTADQDTTQGAPPYKDQAVVIQRMCEIGRQSARS